MVRSIFLAARTGQIFGWEAVISFILVSVVYAVAIGSPSFGEPSCLCALPYLWLPISAS